MDCSQYSKSVGLKIPGVPEVPVPPGVPHLKPHWRIFSCSMPKYAPNVTKMGTVKRVKLRSDSRNIAAVFVKTAKGMDSESRKHLMERTTGLKIRNPYYCTGAYTGYGVAASGQSGSRQYK